MATTIEASRMSSVDTAEMVGSMYIIRFSQSSFGRVVTERLVRKMATTTSSKEGTKAKSAAVMMDVHIKGITTVRTTLAGLAPSTAAARGRSGSTACSPATNVTN